MKRQPAVAGQFYDGDPIQLRNTLAGLIPDNSNKITAKVVVSPHAGYFYSGSVAGETFASTEIPETVIILGPNHHGQGAPMAVGIQDWVMPMGDVRLNRNLAAKITDNSHLFTPDDLAHQFEHSLEVQVPFLQYVQENLSIVPIVVSHLPFDSCHLAGVELAAAIKIYNKPVLIVASTDMTHYESRQRATQQDHLALDDILNLNPSALYNTVLSNRISMCGIMPTTIALTAAIELGATQAELIRYTDSGEAAGDTSKVVGYAGLVIS